MRNRDNKTSRIGRDVCAGENDTCQRDANLSKGEPGKDGLCDKHHALKATPARNAQR